MSFELAKEKAIKYIVLAKKTSQEVRNKLQKSGFDENIIDEVISYLEDLNYLNDNEYVDAYIKQCMRLKNYSIYEIKQKLLQKGVKKDIIENELEKLAKTSYESEIVNKLLNTKLKNMEFIKKKQYLYRRGFKCNLSDDDNLYDEY